MLAIEIFGWCHYESREPGQWEVKEERVLKS